MKKLWVPAAAAVVILATTAGSCGSSSSISNKPVSNNTVAAAGSEATSPPATSAPLAHVGSAIAVADEQHNKANVTLAQVIDPAQGADQYTTPDNGKRFVAAKFMITATSGTVNDDANNDATIIGSDNQTYNADFSSIAGCTNFDSGNFTVAAGSSSTGCVTFQIPTGVTVSKVRFNIAAGFAGATAEWLVP